MAEFPSRIRIVDDDPSCLEVARVALVSHEPSCRVTLDERPATLLRDLGLGKPDCDLLLLDLSLAGISGDEVLKGVRATAAGRGLPVIMLTGSLREVDAEACLNAGADDFVRKPFRPDELIARISAVFRRCGAGKSRPRRLKLGALRADAGEQAATLGETTASLTRMEFSLLALLMERRGEIVARDDILREIWGLSIGPHEKLSTKTLQTHLNNLRQRLAPLGVLIETLPGGLRVRVDAAGPSSRVAVLFS